VDTGGKEEVEGGLSTVFGAVVICTSVQGSKERNIGVVTLNDMSGPGEVASPTHSVSGSILQAPAAMSSHECLLYRCCRVEQGEVDLGRSA
jgi:hypothetical protein